MEKIIGIGESIISNKKNTVLKTYTLGSCIAITTYSQKCRTGGMIHTFLPSPLYPTEGITRPYYYVTTGVPKLIDRMINEFGCRKNDLRIELFAGLVRDKENDVFQVGEMNIISARKVLEEYGLEFYNEDVRYFFSRTVELDIDTGSTRVYSLPIAI